MQSRVAVIGLFLLALPLELAHGQAPVPPASRSDPDSREVSDKQAPKLADDIHETIVKVPVTVKLLSGKSHTGQMVITHFRPKGAGPFPVVIMNHGRAAPREKRAEPPRFRYTAIARFWIRRGFAVLVPTRLGYGETGLDPDPEYSGACNNRDYRPLLAAMVEQTSVTLSYAKTLPWVDASRVIVMGQSYGGFAAIGVSGHGLPGVRATINFAGGGGGDPVNRIAQPCSPAQLSGAINEAGNRAKIPMLWLYAENDKYWGAEWPRKWHAAYNGAGGRAELTIFPPVDDDGHKLIDKGFRLWRPAVDKFISALGFPVPRSAGAPEPSGYAGLAEAGKLPFVKDSVKVDGYQKFLDTDLPRAFAIAPTGNWAWRSGVGDAMEQALASCARAAKQACKLYAVDDKVVWKP